MEVLDIVSITSNFARSIIGRVVNRSIEKKIGHNPGIKLSRLKLQSSKDLVNVDISFSVPIKEFEEIMKEMTKWNEI